MEAGGARINRKKRSQGAKTISLGKATRVEPKAGRGHGNGYFTGMFPGEKLNVLPKTGDVIHKGVCFQAKSMWQRERGIFAARANADAAVAGDTYCCRPCRHHTVRGALASIADHAEGVLRNTPRSAQQHKKDARLLGTRLPFRCQSTLEGGEDDHRTTGQVYSSTRSHRGAKIVVLRT